MQETRQPTDEQRKLRQELERLRAKLMESKDSDIRAVLQLRIDQIVGQLPPWVMVEPEEELQNEPNAALEGTPGEEIPPPTKEQIEAAEKLIVQARVEKMRGNAAKSTDLLKAASAAAPGSAPVLEALGDDLMDRKQLKAAKEAYQKAFRLAPDNVGVEEKLANVALSLGSLGSIEDQMRRNLSDSPFLTESDAVARLPAAVFLSALLPGVGHLVLGRTTQGFAILGAWIVSLVWFLSHWFDFVKLLSMTSHGREKPDMVVIVPLFLMAGIYLGTLTNLKSMSGTVRKKPVERPRPPVDLPFD